MTAACRGARSVEDVNWRSLRDPDEEQEEGTRRYLSRLSLKN